MCGGVCVCVRVCLREIVSEDASELCIRDFWDGPREHWKVMGNPVIFCREGWVTLWPVLLVPTGTGRGGTTVCRGGGSNKAMDSCCDVHFGSLSTKCTVFVCHIIITCKLVCRPFKKKKPASGNLSIITPLPAQNPTTSYSASVYRKRNLTRKKPTPTQQQQQKSWETWGGNVLPTLCGLLFVTRQPPVCSWGSVAMVATTHFLLLLLLLLSSRALWWLQQVKCCFFSSWSFGYRFQHVLVILLLLMKHGFNDLHFDGAEAGSYLLKKSLSKLPSTCSALTRIWCKSICCRKQMEHFDTLLEWSTWWSFLCLFHPKS